MNENPQSTNLSQDVLSDLHSMLHSLLEHRPIPWYDRLHKWVNSPFVVMVIGGAILTYLAHTWQASEASRHDAASKADARRARKESLFAEFAADFESSLDLLVRLREMELWMLARSHDTDARYPVDARTFAEVRTAYLSLREGQWHRIKAPDSLCFRVLAVFSNADVRSAAAQLVDTIDGIEEPVAQTPFRLPERLESPIRGGQNPDFRVFWGLRDRLRAFSSSRALE